ncbi:hypothetical protein ASPCADRAFT_133215 [Aspergillus carbonarius ITEM 5010]|uniref:enoyl-[acyl-carrier-protein] reductase n=1 Tax=Aspergillus carbonarius (strain ITEM 5010) TaxID=602072 RepID=A0A1R3REB2_ASPC5|nr:hypothetical protein ASPCADRAFT_133215 [Aspergillus carbonarius ITEM 5010]
MSQLSASALSFTNPSTPPSTGLTLTKFHLDKPGSGEVQVAFLYAPINPLDLLVVSGKYPVKPRHTVPGTPAPSYVPGYDGVARVIAIGEDISPSAFHEGDLVIPAGLGLGTWRSHANVPASSLLNLTSGLPSSDVPARSDVLAFSILRTVFVTAYLLLEHSRESLKPGDWIILNAATGAIASAVVQLATLRGIQSICVIRDRPDPASNQAAIDELKRYGAHTVLTESELEESAAGIQGKRIVLALDAVFGASAERLAATLAPGGTLVNYGTLGGGGPAASMRLTSRVLFWNQITVRAFRGSTYLAQRTEEEARDMVVWLAGLVVQQRLRMPSVQLVRWGNADKDGVRRAEDRPVGHAKLVWEFEWFEQLK